MATWRLDPNVQQSLFMTAGHNHTYRFLILINYTRNYILD